MAATASKILVVDDDSDLLDLIGVWVAALGHQAVLAPGGLQALGALDDHDDIALVLLDVQMPDFDGLATLDAILERWPALPVVMMTVHGSVEGAVAAMKAGAWDYLPKPLELEKLSATLQNALERASLKREVAQLKRSLQDQYRYTNVVGSSKAMERVFKLAERVTDANVPVLLTGESGVGKEVFARLLHFHGPRKERPFVAVNCAAIPADLLESELFGHERGSFTGAHQRRIGKFEETGTGTILLDEIGELDARMQAKFLRVLQEREFERVGSNTRIPVRCRILAATNRNLEDEIVKGTFREDLYYRLNVVTIDIPPLRERVGDIPPLIHHILKRFREREDRLIEGITPDAMDVLCRYSWPGNVRELENVIFRAGLVTTGPTIDVDALQPRLVAAARGQNLLEGAASPPAQPASGGHNLSIEDHELTLIRAAVLACNGNIKAAADRLGISRSTLYRKLKKLGLEV